jgi:hypothetical protein
MTNEAISYDDFADRVGPIAPPAFDLLSDEAKIAVLQGAWGECAWIQTLTDERILVALNDRLTSNQ